MEAEGAGVWLIDPISNFSCRHELYTRAILSPVFIFCSCSPRSIPPPDTGHKQDLEPARGYGRARCQQSAAILRAHTSQLSMRVWRDEWARTWFGASCIAQPMDTAVTHAASLHTTAFTWPPRLSDPFRIHRKKEYVMFVFFVFPFLSSGTKSPALVSHLKRRLRIGRQNKAMGRWHAG